MVASPFTAAAATPLRGHLFAHDPSTMIQCDGRYYLFATGQGISSKSSADKIFWSAGPRVFASPPSWTTAAVPAFDGTFWAPDIAYFNGQYRLYYSVSSWGSQVSAIGLATNPTLDPAAPNYQWTDQGIVIQSTNGSPYNTIDPCITRDAAGNPWLSFGSYWNGIYLVQLDPLTGKRITANSPTYRLAWKSSGIEASCLYYRGGYYYLFVNWGSCCDGVNSTYNIRVGRSASITGPYLDRSGVDLVNGGGTLFLEGTGKFTGPGHVGILSEGGTEWFSYHYYDAGAWSPFYNDFGTAHFDFEPLTWTADAWPVFTNDWAAVYRFDSDARDGGGQYYGLLRGDATIANDPVRGRVLNLTGANQYVQLPPGVAYARTFAAVVKWNGGGAWQRIFDFGTDTTRYVMLTPSGNGRLRCDIRAGGGTQVLEAANPLPIGAWTHVAVTLDGQRGVLYVNGLAVATNPTMTLSPLEVRARTNHLGRSKYSVDPDFNGQISSFRAYGRVLSAAEIVAPVPVITQPADGSSWSLGLTICFSGSATDFSDVPLAASRLSWRIEHEQNGQTNTVLGPLSGVAGGAYTIPTQVTAGVHRVLLTATDGAGRQRTVSATLSPGTPAVGSSYYPFTSGAQDASNRFNGTLNGGAAIASDATRGHVLNLSGAGQYVSLPAGAAALRTYSGWVYWRGGGAWQRVFDFGRDTSHWFFLSPRDADGRMQCAITSDRSTFLQIISAPAALPTNVWTHLAVVLDGRQGILYVNGQAVAVNNSVNLLPSDVGATSCYFGRSQYPVDPYFNGRLDSARLHSDALTLADIMGEYFALPALSVRVASAQLRVSWPDWAAELKLFSTTQLTPPVSWFPVTNVPVSAGDALELVLPMNEENRFYRLQKF